jgi:hypothetical protein
MGSIKMISASMIAGRGRGNKRRPTLERISVTVQTGLEALNDRLSINKRGSSYRQEFDDGGRYRFRTCDLSHVKGTLYH